MGMTFLQQQNKLSRLLQDSNFGEDDMWPISDRKFEINRGEVQFARDSKALWGYTTGTVSSQAIDFPSDFLETNVLMLTVGSQDVLVSNEREIGLEDLNHYQDSGNYHYYVWVDSSGTRQIKFVDTSADGLVYKWWYYKKPTTDLSLDADESSHIDEYREASVYYAAAELLEQVGKTQMADRYRAKYNYFVTKANQETGSNYIDRTRAFPDMGEQHVYDTSIQGIGSGYGQY